MEESSTAVETQPQPPDQNLPAIPPSQVPASTFTKVDNNLTGIGFFTASSKRSRREIEKTTVIVDQGVERRISILPSAKYGLPITQDQDFWLALMKLVSEHIQREGKLTNPFTFTTAELTKILGQAHSGKNYKAVEEWLAVMVSTTVEGGAYNTVQKSWMTKRTHAVEQTVTVGKELPDGTIADKNNIWFSQWQLDNINAGNLIAVELGIYTQLENNISKNLVPHLQEWLYASQRDGRFEKQYEDVCQLLGIRVYKYRSDIERQLNPSLIELTTYGYISKSAIEPMADRKHYKLVLWHGPKYHRDRQARLSKKPGAEILPAEENSPTRRPRQQRLYPRAEIAAKPEQPSVIIDYRLVAELAKRGVGEQDARQLLSTLKPDQLILDQLEYLDFQIQQASGSRSEIKNPPGFYIERLRANIAVPPTFETSNAKIARQQAEFERRQAITAQQEAALAAEEAERQNLDAQIAALPEEARLALMNQAKADVLASHPNMAQYFSAHPDSAMEDGAVRRQVKELLAQGWQPPQPQNPHYAINPPVRQATALQEPGSDTVQEIDMPSLTNPGEVPTQPILARADRSENVTPKQGRVIQVSRHVAAQKPTAKGYPLQMLETILATLQLPASVKQPAVELAPAAEPQPENLPIADQQS